MTIRHVSTAVGVFLALGLMVYFCALPGDLPADEDTTSGLAGTYAVNGVDPLGVEYSGTVVIVTTDTVGRFEIEWIVTGGIHRGFGTQVGRDFVVQWETVASGGGTGEGSANYVIGEDGQLVGTRRVFGFDVEGTETMFPDP